MRYLMDLFASSGSRALLAALVVALVVAALAFGLTPSTAEAGWGYCPPPCK